ncbi:MAG: hypothetical protein AAF761_04170 [Pseudomonadota bacterium]
MPRFFALAALILVSLPTTASANWRVGPGSEAFVGTTSAFGLAQNGVNVLAVMCKDGAPLVWTMGYPAKSGPNSQETFTVTVGGQTYPVTGVHVPPDGLWTGRADGGLISALSAGNSAVVAVPGQPAQTVSLRGSSAALASVLGGCAASPATGTTTPNNTTTTVSAPALFDAVITAACGGAYTLAEGAEFTGLLDGDTTPDVVLDWAGVTCADRSRGRGAGFCGAALCTIEVAFSSTPEREQILGVNPRLIDRGFERQALRTSTQGATCGGPAQGCDVTWRWTGAALEPFE